jgi:hypothetical protein
MSQFDLRVFAEELNIKAQSHPIGDLQQVRAALHGTRAVGRRIFSSLTITDEWAFHHGGRSELQFNIGFDGQKGKMLRYGVAFSFETSRSLPTINVLIPKVKLFNDFLRLYPDLYGDMRMWHWQGERSSEYSPTPIAPELVTNGVFVFFGKRGPVDALDADLILTNMDRLLPLYEYVESNGRRQPLLSSTEKSFMFQPGLTKKLPATKATRAQKELDVSLRHNILQEALYHKLVDEYGPDNVGTELPTGVGTSVDLVVRRPDAFWFYEIKTFQSPRACIREAVGQLLEYSFWPGSKEACRLVVVGESAAQKDALEYCRRLKKRFSLPIEYQQIAIKNG